MFKSHIKSELRNSEHEQNEERPQQRRVTHTEKGRGGLAWWVGTGGVQVVVAGSTASEQDS